MDRTTPPTSYGGVRMDHVGLVNILVAESHVVLMGISFSGQQDDVVCARRALCRAIMRDMTWIPPAKPIPGADMAPPKDKAEIYAELLAQESEGDPWTLARAMVAMVVESAAKEDGEGPATALVHEIRRMTGNALIERVTRRPE